MSTGMIKDEFVEFLSTVLGSPSETYPLHSPKFDNDDHALVEQCLTSTYVSTSGPYTGTFETKLMEFTGAKHVIAVVNGTSALQLAIECSGIPNGSEIFIPAISFAATANAVIHAGQVPHFVDVEDDTLGIDPGKLREHIKTIATTQSGSLINRSTGRPISGLIPMHALGHPCQISELKLLAEEFNLVLIEDAAESLGSFSNGAHTGLEGIGGILSFNGNKTITTGGGGAIITNDEQFASRVRHLSTTAKVPHAYRFIHDEAGYNFRMPNLNAALGVSQMNKLPEMLESKRNLAKKYQESITFSWARVLSERQNSFSNYWLNSIMLNEPDNLLLEDLIEFAVKNGFTCRPLWEPLTTLNPYEVYPSGNVDCALDVSQRVICLPSSAWHMDQS